MRVLRVISSFLVLVIATPVLAQSAFETHDQAARRRQAERYQEEKSRQNVLTPDRQRPLGEAAPSHVSNPPARRETYNPNLPRECPPNQMMCR